MKVLTLYELNISWMITQIDLLKKFFNITKEYNIKSNNHLKLLCMIINNINSSNSLNLKET